MVDPCKNCARATCPTLTAQPCRMNGIAGSACERCVALRTARMDCAANAVDWRAEALRLREVAGVYQEAAATAEAEVERLCEKLASCEAALERAQGGWVRVDERLPAVGAAVLTSAHGSDAREGHIWALVTDVLAGWDDTAGRAIAVTHWMPLPEPPKEKR